MPRRRIWCETVPHDELIQQGTVALLRRHAIEPIIAVWPETLSSIGRVVARFEDAGLAVALWPMLADADGRWANAGNAAAFAAFVDRVAVVDPAPREIAIDLEPAIEAMRASIASRARSVHYLPITLDRGAFAAADRALCELVDRLHARGLAVSAAIPPTALFDPPKERGRAPWQELLGTPVDGPAWDRVSVMLYTSILEGWSRGALDRADVRALFAHAARAAAARFGARAGASLGAVGTGAFGDEPTYRAPRELAEDAACAQAAGLDDLALFDLGGVLRRPPAEAWLDAFVATSAARSLPPPTLRSRAALAAAGLAGSAFGALGRLRDAVAPARSPR